MKVMLTGGTGFVGAWTAYAIAQAGHQVRYLVRTPDKLAVSAGALGLDTSDHVVGDITDAEAVRRPTDPTIARARRPASSPGLPDR